MTTSAEQMGAWNGPAILSYGFRAFFLLGSAWAAIVMVLWVLMLAGYDVLSTAFDPVSWHAHEFLFGYLGAVLAGFLLTAVPNWTGRLPIVGWPWGVLVGLWLAERVAVATSALMPWGVAAAIDLAFPMALFAALAREVAVGRNWKNLPVLGLLSGMIAANWLYHLEAAQGGYPAKGVALRMGLAVAVMLISLIGGRIVPGFTRNWLVQHHNPALPTPFGRSDAIILALTGMALMIWTLWPDLSLAAVTCGVAGMVQTWRLSRWSGRHTLAEPLVWVLHAGYACVPLGFFAVAAGAFLPAMALAAQHVWMAGAGVATRRAQSKPADADAARPTDDAGIALQFPAAGPPAQVRQAPRPCAPARSVQADSATAFQTARLQCSSAG